MTERLTHIDFFAGVGGFSFGFEASGLYETKLLVDSDASAVNTFKRNRPRIPYWRTDLSTVEPEQVLELVKLGRGELDVLTAGPPCQGLSRIGTRQLDDPRNALLRHTAELIDGLRPKIALIENVPALSWNGQSKLLDELADILADAGYRSDASVLDAWRFGVPQMRRRLFLLAARSDVDLSDPIFPVGHDAGSFTAQELIRAADDGEPKCPPGLSVEEAIGDLPVILHGHGDEIADYGAAPNDLSDYQRARRGSADLLFNHRARKHSLTMLGRMSMIPEGGRNFELPDKERLRGEGEYFSQAYGRLHRNGIAQTITTYFQNPGSGRFIHYRELRALTVREAARFQSFDDDVMFLGKSEQQMRHVGNAVPPLVAKALADHCAIHLTGEPRIVSGSLADVA